MELHKASAFLLDNEQKKIAKLFAFFGYSRIQYKVGASDLSSLMVLKKYFFRKETVQSTVSKILLIDSNCTPLVSPW
ncbi:MAG: hypothetical protein OQK04_12325 [Kangiellaceae bacterium]|nr:hypothetical protein [Kangiellaceae bacterium]MCW8999487.1 hypothetical protein [Kangiellaceae bacterium]